MKNPLLPTSLVLCAATVACAPAIFAQTNDNQSKQPSPESAEIRTPHAPATPRINGADIFGVRPGGR